jgi:hypothetical protein
MDMPLIAVDVDGTLANPMVQLAVVAWGLVLAAPLLLAYLRLPSRGARVVASLCVLGFGCIWSPIATRAIVTLMYQIKSKPGTWVGFFGGPPFFASPLVAVTTLALVALVMGRGAATR